MPLPCGFCLLESFPYRHGEGEKEGPSPGCTWGRTVGERKGGGQEGRGMGEDREGGPAPPETLFKVTVYVATDDVSISLCVCVYMCARARARVCVCVCVCTPLIYSPPDIPNTLFAPFSLYSL